MRRKGTARFVLAVVAMFSVYERTFAPTQWLGYAALGGLGLIGPIAALLGRCTAAAAR